MSEIEFHVEQRSFGYGVALYARQIQGKKMFRAEPLVMAEHEEGLIFEPFCQIDNNSAQQLMDKLWQVGFRPSEGTGSAGALKAVETHLSDMRRIAFNRLKIEGQNQ